MSQRQPVYRRPSWAQTDASYKIYMRKDLAADRSPGQDNGLENFSYDPAHLPKWQSPEDLSKRLPSNFRNAVADWEYAGAALSTALERINKLDQESLFRGYPDKPTRSPLLQSSQGSNASAVVFAADTPPMSSPVMPAADSQSGHMTTDKSFEGLPLGNTIGMTSPPFTPADSQACSTPDPGHVGKPGQATSTMPDAQQLAKRLTPISSQSRVDSVSSASRPAVPTFDENAWERFLSIYKADLDDIQHHALPRFKGAGYVIDRMRVELTQDDQNHSVLEDFQKWWAEKKVKVQECDDRVRDLHEPTIELIRMERAAQGLPI